MMNGYFFKRSISKVHPTAQGVGGVEGREFIVEKRTERLWLK